VTYKELNNEQRTGEKIIKDTFESSYDKKKSVVLIKEPLNKLEESTLTENKTKIMMMVNYYQEIKL